MSSPQTSPVDPPPVCAHALLSIHTVVALIQVIVMSGQDHGDGQFTNFAALFLALSLCCPQHGLKNGIEVKSNHANSYLTIFIIFFT